MTLFLRIFWPEKYVLSCLILADNFHFERFLSSVLELRGVVMSVGLSVPGKF